MTAIKQFLKPALLGFALVSTSACVHTDVNVATPHQTVMRNSVQMVRLPHEIAPEGDGTDTLSAMTETSIDRFLTSINAGYGDVIMLDGPSASPERIAAVEAVVTRTGLAYGGTSALGAKPKDGSVMLYVERYVVTTPNCNYWPEVTSTQEKNNDSNFHGCASTINLGLMVANPRDLVSGHYSGTSTAAAVGALGGGPAPSGSSSGSGSSPGPGAQALQSAVESLPTGGND